MTAPWKAYADVDPFGRDVRLNIYADHEDGQRYDSVSSIGSAGAVATTLVCVENAAIESGLRVSMPIAEAMYQALDRVFGKHHNQDTLEMALLKEQARVDHVLGSLLNTRPGMPQAGPIPSGPIL